MAVSRQPCGKAIDNSRRLQGPLVLGLPAVGPNVVVPRRVVETVTRATGHAASQYSTSWLLVASVIAGGAVSYRFDDGVASQSRRGLGTEPTPTTEVQPGIEPRSSLSSCIRSTKTIADDGRGLELQAA